MIKNCDCTAITINCTMISRNSHSSMSPQLTIGRTVLKESDDLVILGVTFDSKMTFEKQLRSVSRAASQKTWYLEEVLASVPR